jgi:hypothetical protein
MLTDAMKNRLKKISDLCNGDDDDDDSMIIG